MQTVDHADESLYKVPKQVIADGSAGKYDPSPFISLDDSNLSTMSDTKGAKHTVGLPSLDSKGPKKL